MLTPFLEYCYDLNLPEIKGALVANKDVILETDDMQRNCLHFLIDGYSERSIDVTDENDWAAAKTQGAKVAQLLVQAGANLDQQRNTGDTPLMSAIQAGLEEITECLILAGANLNLQESVFGNTALHYAEKSGDENLYNFLLSSGADHTIRKTRGGRAADDFGP